MKCRACNCDLSDFESTRKYSGTNEYVDLCNSCFFLSDHANINVEEREDLRDFITVEKEDE